MGGDVRVVADTPWPVATDPDVTGAAPTTVLLTDGGVATSGTRRRVWKGGHHLIDPRTGRPAVTAWHSVSVSAGSAADANAAATAAVILGEQGPAWVAAAGLDADFVAPGRRESVNRWQVAA
jgi:thiamine biosynthesis lipoprotein